MLLTLSGCNNIIHNWILTQSENTCKDKNGIDYVMHRTLSNTYFVTCNNGKQFHIKVD